MKRKLLLLVAFVTMTVASSAQTTAYPAGDMIQCGNEVFNLTVQTPVILGSQSVAEFTVGYYETMADAAAQANPISIPSAYVSAPSQEIFARVTKTIDGTFDITSFTLSWTALTEVPDVPDVTVCDSYVLPIVPGISYATDMAGTAAAPATITTSMTIYRRSTDFPCATPSSFVVTIIDTPVVYDIPDVVTCDFYILPPLEYGNYYSGPSGTGQLLFAGDAIYSSQTVYIFATTGTCSAEESFEVFINFSNPYAVNNVSACLGYTLPNLPPGYEYYSSTTGMDFSPVPIGTVITESTFIQVVGDANVCFAISDFIVFIGDPPHGNPTPLVGCDADGDGYGTFNLDERIGQIRNGLLNVVVTFHETMIDAENGINALPSPYFNTTANSQVVYARVENPAGGCFSVVALQLNTQVCGTISGTVRLDIDNNGCTAADPVATNRTLRYDNSSGTHYTYTNNFGQYTFTDVYPGSITLHLTTGGGFSGNPASQTLSVLPSGNYTADFCLIPSPINTTSDARVYLSASTAARPGFAAGYNVIIRNDGNTALTGTATFTFDESKLDFTVANPAATSQTANTIAFDVSGLLPAQYQVFNIAFMVKEPPVVNSGDMLNFSAVFANTQTDATPANNTALYGQEVVNSYDPNDIIIHQGAYIYQENMPEELVYTVRFQNTGTASAINVRIETVLDDLLNWNTFRPIAASHNYVVQRDYGNRVAFRFNGINLPNSGANEPASHGYVVFAAKPSWLMQLGSIVSAQADIYFDFNAPITTNTVTTEVINLLGVGENELASVKMYPNPATQVVNIETDNVFTVELYDIQGKKIMEDKGENQLSVDVSVLQKGMYFVKVVTDTGSEVKELLVK